LRYTSNMRTLLHEQQMIITSKNTTKILKSAIFRILLIYINYYNIHEYINSQQHVMKIKYAMLCLKFTNNMTRSSHVGNI